LVLYITKNFYIDFRIAIKDALLHILTHSGQLYCTKDFIVDDSYD